MQYVNNVWYLDRRDGMYNRRAGRIWWLTDHAVIHFPHWQLQGLICCCGWSTLWPSHSISDIQLPYQNLCICDQTWTLSLRAGSCSTHSPNGTRMFCQKEIQIWLCSEERLCHFPLLGNLNEHGSVQNELRGYSELLSLHSSHVPGTWRIFLTEYSLDYFGLWY